MDADDCFALRRGLFARLFGTTGASFVWLGLALTLPPAALAGDLDFTWSTLGLLLLGGGFAVLEMTAWARACGAEVRWRSLLRVRAVPLGDVTSVDLARFPFPGDIPVLALRLRDGTVRRVRPSVAVGNRARHDFADAIAERAPGAVINLTSIVPVGPPRRGR